MSTSPWIFGPAYSVEIGSERYPVQSLRLRKYADLRPGYFVVEIPSLSTYGEEGFGELVGTSAGTTTDTVGGTNLNVNQPTGTVLGVPVAITGSGSLASIGLNWQGVQACNVRVALYSAGAGKPANLLAESASVAANIVAGWQDVPVTGYTVAPGSYWLAFQVSATKGVYYNTGNRSYYAKAYGAFDAAWSGASTQDAVIIYNMRVTYTQAGSLVETPVWFGKFTPVNIFRDGQLYMAGSILGVDDLGFCRLRGDPPSVQGGAPTTVVSGLDWKLPLLIRRFEKAASSTVTYGAPGSTEVAIFSDIMDTPNLGLYEGVVDATTVSGLLHVFKGQSCAQALEVLQYIAAREIYLRNDRTLDFRTSVGSVKTPMLTWGGNVNYARKGVDGWRVFNDLEGWYNKGASQSTTSDANSITQFGQRDLTFDLYSVTDATAVGRYRDNLLRDFKLPKETGAVGFHDLSVGLEYDVGDWVILNIPQRKLVGQYRVLEIAKKYDRTGEGTVLLLGPPGIKLYDTRRYRTVDLQDALSVIQGALQSLGRY